MKKKTIRGIIYFLSFITCGLILYVGFVFLHKGINNYITHELTYKPQSTPNYKVYYKKNEFFTDEYIEEGKSYISSLIDYIFINYNYGIKFDDFVNGKYEYSIRATINAYNSDDKNIWSNTYDLSDVTENEYSKTDSFNFLDSISVDYSFYNDEFNNFKKTLSIPCTGELVVDLNVISDNTNENIIEPIMINDKVSFSIPLSTQTTEVTPNSSQTREPTTVKSIERINDKKYSFYRAIAITCFVIVTVIVTINVRIMKYVHDIYIYEFTKKKIINNYDSIIVNVKGKPVFEDFNIINLEDFESLIDAHSEVRMPINYYDDEANDRCLFVLMNENTAWVYMLDANRLKSSKGLK